MNLFDLFVKIGVDDQASEHISKLSSGFKTGLATAAKVGTAAVAAAATGITALTSAAVSNYAEYEQLVGGVDTLFMESSQKLQDYAANAYKTAGMSANDYMSTATSFAASLVSSLDGDTDAAVEAANRAITDMSDNANKMGTDISMIQNAYQGFAKQNYTMLDNLKLGYGGTKTEMERLLTDADALSESFNLQVDKSGALVYSYADVVDAIHIIQQEMGITGTTADEAGKTVSGSARSMKAAWENLVTGIADDNADLDQLIDNFVETVQTSFEGNLLPRIEKGIGGVADLITGIAPILIQEVPKLLEDIAPKAVDGINSIIDSIVQVLPDAAGVLVNTAVPIITDSAPKLIEAGVELLNALIGAVSANQDAIFDGAFEIVNTLALGIFENLPKIVSMGIGLVISLAESLVDNVDKLIPAAINCVMEIVDTLTDPDTLSKLLDAALVLIHELAFGLVDAIPNLVDATVQIITSLSQFLSDPEVLGDLIVAAVEIVVALGAGIINAIPGFLENIDTLVVDAIDRLYQTDWLGLGADIINKIWAGLKSVGSSIVDWFSGLFSGNDTEVTADGSHASGLDYVPKNNYLANLHQGEAVLTAQEAEIWRSGRSGMQGANITINIQSGVVSDSGTAKDLAQRISEELQALSTNNNALVGGWT